MRGYWNRGRAGHSRPELCSFGKKEKKQQDFGRAMIDDPAILPTTYEVASGCQRVSPNGGEHLFSLSRCELTLVASAPYVLTFLFRPYPVA